MRHNGQARQFPKIGMRNIKTAIAAALCAFVYYFFDRSPAFACIGAIFGMGSDLEMSKLHGGNRLFGTVIGGLLGMALFRIYLIFYPERALTASGCTGVYRHHPVDSALPAVLGGRCAARRRGAVHCTLQHPGGYLCELCPEPYDRHRRRGGHVPAHQRSAPPGAAGRLAGKARRLRNRSEAGR